MSSKITIKSNIEESINWNFDFFKKYKKKDSEDFFNWRQYSFSGVSILQPLG